MESFLLEWGKEVSKQGATLTSHVQLAPGDPAPWFKQRSLKNPSYSFDSAAGRYLVLCFFGSAADPDAQAALRAAQARADLFDDQHASFFGVSHDATDEGRLQERYPGYRFFLDLDLKISRLYGAAPAEASAITRPLWAVISPDLRLLYLAPLKAPDAVLAFLSGLPPPGLHAGFEAQAPILLLPNVFEIELCERLIATYEDAGGEASGFMRDVDGRTTVIHDSVHKRRRDHLLQDPSLLTATRERFLRRVIPAISKAFQFQVTRMERFLVACYSEQEQGHFRAHRDNTTKGTAHRRFAVSLNLNADFDGGLIEFPEYGQRGYKPAPGAAVVFSCSLLHQVTPVTRGRRFAFLPFLYDEAAAKLREENNPHLSPEVSAYRA